MKFPDSSVNALLLLALAGTATGIANWGLRALLGDPQSSIVSVLLTVLAFAIGFGIVYSPYAYQARRQALS